MKEDTIWVIVIIALVVIGIGYFVYQGGVKTLEEHKKPANLEEQTQNTGMDVTFYNKDGEPVPAPDWFKTVEAEPLGAVVSRTDIGETTCQVVSDCPGYEDNPAILCYDFDYDDTSECILKVASIGIDMSVSSGGVDYRDVKITNSSPQVFTQALPTTQVDLDRNSTTAFESDIMKLESDAQCPVNKTCLDATSLKGSVTNFYAKIEGYNKFTGQWDTASDNINFRFSETPQGNLSLAIQSPI